MADIKRAGHGFTGFGIGTLSSIPAAADVFLLVVYRDGSLTAAAYATERGAMEAALYSLADEQEDEPESGQLEDLFARARQRISDEGGVMEIVPSPIHGG